MTKRSFLFFTTAALLLNAYSCATLRDDIKDKPSARPYKKSTARMETNEAVYTDSGVGFPILPFELSERTGIGVPEMRVVPEEAGFWLVHGRSERRWTVERRDGNLVAFQEDEKRIRFATFHLNEGPHGKAFELQSATLFGPDGKSLIKFQAEKALPDLTRTWKGRFVTGFSIESNAKAASYDGRVVAERTGEGATVRFYRDNMLSGATPLFAVEITAAADGSFIVSRLQ